jgi:hypothetical protein
VARQSSNRRKGNPPRAAQTPPPEPEDAVAAEEADELAQHEPVAEAAEGEDDAAQEAADDGAAEGDDDLEAHRALWEELRIAPVEIALPAGTGYTLRAYRMSTELTATDTSDRDDDDPFAARARQAELDDVDEDDETVVILDEEFLEDEPEEEPDRRRRRDRDADDEPDDAAGEDEEMEEEEGEEVPVFLTHRGRLLLFRNPESLVSFVRSGADNDLAQVDTWTTMVERIQPADIAPLDEDSYELDLVVENLRGGHDTWDPTLLIEAGEVARDLAYALRMPAVLDMLSPGSRLDDLDEALRSSVQGGVGGFLARRRLRKIGAQTASLGWRTIIGKISAAVDWRD